MKHLTVIGILGLLLAAVNIVLPAEPPLLIDGSPTEFVDEPDAPPAVLVTPCEIGPRNLPILDPDRSA